MAVHRLAEVGQYVGVGAASRADRSEGDGVLAVEHGHEAGDGLHSHLDENVGLVDAGLRTPHAAGADLHRQSRPIHDGRIGQRLTGQRFCRSWRWGGRGRVGVGVGLLLPWYRSRRGLGFGCLGSGIGRLFRAFRVRRPVRSRAITGTAVGSRSRRRRSGCRDPFAACALIIISAARDQKRNDQKGSSSATPQGAPTTEPAWTQSSVSAAIRVSSRGWRIASAMPQSGSSIHM